MFGKRKMLKPDDPLKFKDDKAYTSRLSAARKKTGRDDAIAQ